MTLAAAKLQFEARTHTREGKRQARREKLLARIARDGKLCTSCHGRKPADAFNACEPRLDGLQMECRSCAKLRTALLADATAGRQAWYAARDGMRAHAAAVAHPPKTA
jgi:hypothetical protein